MPDFRVIVEFWRYGCERSDADATAEGVVDILTSELFTEIGLPVSTVVEEDERDD